MQNIQMTQRKSATTAIAPRAATAPEAVRDEAPLNAGVTAAVLLLSVVPVLVLMEAVMVVPLALWPEAAEDEAAMGEVDELMRVRLGAAELIRVMPGRLE